MLFRSIWPSNMEYTYIVEEITTCSLQQLTTKASRSTSSISDHYTMVNTTLVHCLTMYSMIKVYQTRIVSHKMWLLTLCPALTIPKELYELWPLIYYVNDHNYDNSWMIQTACFMHFLLLRGMSVKFPDCLNILKFLHWNYMKNYV